ERAQRANGLAARTGEHGGEQPASPQPSVSGFAVAPVAQVKVGIGSRVPTQPFGFSSNRTEVVGHFASRVDEEFRLTPKVHTKVNVLPVGTATQVGIEARS